MDIRGIFWMLFRSSSVILDKARLVFKPLDGTVEVDTKISFFCKADGNPVPSVEWKVNGEYKRASRYVVKKASNGLSTLRIEPVRMADHNVIITCSADNGVGKPVSSSAKLRIVETPKLPQGFPQIKEDPQLKAVEKGRTAHVRCLTSGIPHPEILWLRDLMPINVQGNPRYTVARLGNPELPNYILSTLMITKSNEEDEGKYECVARNQHGVAHSKAAHLYVKVRRVPPHFSIPPKRSYKVKAGGTLNLTCVAVGYPMPNVFWRQGDKYDTNAKASAPIGKNVLTLTDVEKTENWTCVAVSNLGNIEASTTVEVKDLPKPPENLRVVNNSAKEVNASWDPVRFPDDEEPVYVVEYRMKYSEADNWEESEPTKATKLMVGGLEPFTEYEVRVKSQSSIGFGKPSRPKEVMTNEARPGTVPINVQSRAMGPEAILVTWDPPEKPYGIIKHYRIFYNLEKDSPYDSWPRMEIDDTKMIRIEGLIPDATYYVAIQAKNHVGFSDLSETISVVVRPGGEPSIST